MSPGTLVSYSPSWAEEMGLIDHRLYIVISHDLKNKLCRAITSDTGEIKLFWTEDLIELGA